MHVHDSALQAFLVFAMVIVLGTGWRVLSARWSENPAGKAMAFIY